MKSSLISVLAPASCIIVSKGGEVLQAERNKTIILWGEAPYALDTDRGPKALIFKSIQRNKIKILLRWDLIFTGSSVTMGISQNVGAQKSF